MKSAGHESPYVSRAGLKLEHALRTFGVSVDGVCCADFGCNAGGFTDCLLQHGARSVHAIDTGYGALAWSLRNDDRVRVLERTNALHLRDEEVEGSAPFGVIVIDLGWTPQAVAVPAALRWLKADGSIITLIKPHYEFTARERGRRLPKGGLPDAMSEEVLHETLNAMPGIGAAVIAWCESPLRGGKSGKGGAGQREFLAHLRPQTTAFESERKEHSA